MKFKFGKHEGYYRQLAFEEADRLKIWHKKFAWKPTKVCADENGNNVYVWLRNILVRYPRANPYFEVYPKRGWMVYVGEAEYKEIGK